MRRKQSEVLQRKKKNSNFRKNAHSFFVLYFERANIHGFSYFGLQYLQIVEKYWPNYVFFKSQFF